MREKKEMDKHRKAKRLLLSLSVNCREILPCLICGGEASLRDNDWGAKHIGLNYDHYVECSNCGKQSPQVKGWEENKAIKMWNDWRNIK